MEEKFRRFGECKIRGFIRFKRFGEGYFEQVMFKLKFEIQELYLFGILVLKLLYCKLLFYRYLFKDEKNNFFFSQDLEEWFFIVFINLIVIKVK